MTLIMGEPDSRVPIADRSFNYGDGVFSTLVSHQGHVQLLDLHISRLQLSAIKLGMVTIDWQQLKQALLDAACESRTVIKVLVSRGCGGRGYSSQNTTPDIYITRSDYPESYLDWRRAGIALGVSEVKLGLNPALAGIKHCNRLEQVLIKNAMADKPWQDEIVTDLTGAVVECSAANLFWYTKGNWYTPLLTASGVNGVMKQHLIEHVPALKSTRQVKIGVGAIAHADSLFISNAVMGLVPVHTLTLKNRQFSFDMAPCRDLAGQLEKQIPGYA